ncbi:GAF domain-containing protein [Parapedobacter soli]|uniref:GAF domain-containing protein n=1 Tax=Parapedobacter soli TaxID=416955 RepID=UPI0021C99E5A|nr:GAF domain-containing protein [Parapedobacter soli]
MAEEFNIVRGTKEEQYKALLPQLRALVGGEPDLVANMANIAAVLKAQFDFFWVGFYLVKGDELILGPFQGPVACTRIGKGRGVCGTAWERTEALIVPNVDTFPGHIACSAQSKSEIVIPVMKHGDVIAVLDVDSEYLNHFDETDAAYLAKVVALLSR